MLVVGTYATPAKANVSIFHAATGEEVCHADFVGGGRTAGKANVQTMSASDDGWVLAVGGDTPSVAVFHVVDGSPSPASNECGSSLVLAGRLGYPSQVMAVALSGEGSLLAVAGQARRVQLWSLEHDRGRNKLHAALIFQFNCHTTVYGLDMSADGSLVIAGTSKRTELWRVHRDGLLVDKTEKGPMSVAEGQVRPTDDDSDSAGDPRPVPVRCEPLQVFQEAAPQGGVSCSRDGSRLAIGGDQLVTVHDVHSGSTLRVFRQRGRVRCVALSPPGDTLVSGGFDKHASLWAIDAGADLMEARTKMDAVRCVDVHGTLFAVGGTTSSGGLAQLFDTTRSITEPVAEWPRKAEVRCVRFNGRKGLLAVAGHDCVVRVKCTALFTTLCELSFLSRGPVPHFIWSVDFSLDARVLAVGCWSGKAHVYSLGTIADASAAHAKDRRPRPPLRPAEVATVTRADRVYSVSLDAMGSRLLVGGRDKKAALYDLSSTLPPGRCTAELLWEESSDEFVYTVSLARNAHVCAFAGMSKTVRVLHAVTRQPLFEVPVSGTVHAVAVQEDGSCVAVCGELPFLSIYDATGAEQLSLPTTFSSFSLALSSACLAYTQEGSGLLLGRGDSAAFGWQDQPSFSMAATVVSHSAEETIARFLRCALLSHPSLANARSPDSGSSFLQFIVERSREPEIINLVLGAATHIGLQPDEELTTAMHAALETRNRVAVRCILAAVLRGHIFRVPGTMRQVFSCFEALAKQYPQEFLDFIRRCDLEPEPEVLLNCTVNVDEVTVPRRLVRGSAARYPRGLWDKDLARFVASPWTIATVVEGLKAALRVRMGPTATECTPGGEGATRVGHRVDSGILPSQSSALSLRAMRVPFEHFAGASTDAKRAHSSALQLVSNAARRTGDYSVFGSPLISTTLQFKWEAFARRQFWLALSMYALKVCVCYVHIFSTVFPLSSNGAPSPIVGKPLSTVLSGEGRWLTMATWLATSAFAVNDEYQELRQMRVADSLGGYLFSWSFFDQMQIMLQATANAMLLTAAIQAEDGDAFRVDLAWAWPLAYIGPESDSLGSPGRALRAAGTSTPGASSYTLRLPKYVDVEGTTALIAICEALVLLCLHIKLLYYARGVERMGVLVRMMLQIAEDMIPFLKVLFVILLGFGSSLYVLRRHIYTEPHLLVYAASEILDAGLYANIPDNAYAGAGLVQITLFAAYMFVTQIVLLNLLIAIMSTTFNKVRSRAPRRFCAL